MVQARSVNFVNNCFDVKTVSSLCVCVFSPSRISFSLVGHGGVVVVVRCIWGMAFSLLAN